LIIICIDGRQHFEQVQKWKSPEKQHHNDVFKTISALEEGYSVIRFFQEDVWKSRIDWKNIIVHEIEIQSNVGRLILVSKNNVYDKIGKCFPDAIFKK